MEGFIFHADVFTEQVKEGTEGSRFNTRDMLLAISLVLAIGFGLFAWVYFRVRKKADRADQERISQMTQSIAAPESKAKPKGERRRKRRRRRDHRPRNPSLEKTGGLPPLRPDDQLPKY